MGDPIVCKICGAGFREEHIKEGKCDSCNKLYPKANSLQEAREMKNPQLDKFNEGNMHKVIVEKVYDVLVNEGILTECECGVKYFKRSPRQTVCSDCGKAIKKETDK